MANFVCNIQYKRNFFYNLTFFNLNFLYVLCNYEKHTLTFSHVELLADEIHLLNMHHRNYIIYK